SKYAPSTHHGVRSARIPQNPTRLLSFPHNVRRHLVTFPKFGDLPSSLESAASIFPTSRQSTANEGVHTPDPAYPRRRPLVMRQIQAVSKWCTLDMAIAMALRESKPGPCEQTVNVLQLMEEEGFEPSLVMLNSLINAFGTAGRHLEALAVFQHIKDSV
ncbi:hypothetical protein ACJX0J_006228, partial [Zea mays]